MKFSNLGDEIYIEIKQMERNLLVSKDYYTFADRTRCLIFWDKITNGLFLDFTIIAEQVKDDYTGLT